MEIPPQPFLIAMPQGKNLSLLIFIGIMLEHNCKHNAPTMPTRAPIQKKDDMSRFSNWKDEIFSSELKTCKGKAT